LRLAFSSFFSSLSLSSFRFLLFLLRAAMQNITRCVTNLKQAQNWCSIRTYCILHVVTTKKRVGDPGRWMHVTINVLGVMVVGSGWKTFWNRMFVSFVFLKGNDEINSTSSTN
jgi:hypothetical protein